ncbi:hypothetical protein EK21DRAFT_111941 [Setomelanomma holmii]|uniref:Uncharacterized protein n=1 Tax=Setomelanomma holmii TaxID=210430 RepID=A0A9P4HAB3_9PLEO|nr:hypothetical protein EK21DRAFT_111941 [Setomelanomma holmii]
MAKRTIDAVSASTPVDVPQTSADMAELLREKLVAKYDSTRKKRKIGKRQTIDVNKISPLASTAPFFKLDREVRNIIYQELWAATPVIEQRYKRQTWQVSYGELVLSSSGFQILLEGLAEFHQRSVWHFETSTRYRASEYIFPLITPALVREYHLIIDQSTFPPPGLLAPNCPFDMLEYNVERSDGTEEVACNLVPKAKTMALINMMTASAKEYSALAKIKMTIVFDYHAFLAPDTSHGGNGYVYRTFDLSRFDRLAVHRHLRTFETKIFVKVDQHHQYQQMEGATIDAVITELGNVGQALIPGGKSTQKGS